MYICNMDKVNTKKELSELLDRADEQLVVLKFSASWCNPCKQLGKIIEKIKGDFGNVRFVECDIDESDELVEEFNIMSIPVLVYFKEGQPVDKTVGGLSESQLINKIYEHLN